MKKNTILFTIVMLLLCNLAQAQFPGKKSKEPFVAIDSVTYHKGDYLELAKPSKVTEFENVGYYEHKSVLDYTSEILDGQITQSFFSSAPADLKGFTGKIKYFKNFRANANEEYTTFAIVPVNSQYRVAIDINSALNTGELVSSNNNFIPLYSTPKNEEIDENTEITTLITKFSKDHDIKLVSVEGSNDDQTVTLNFTTQHQLVHQKICLSQNKDSTKLFDEQGNEYFASKLIFGQNEHHYSVCNKVPTGTTSKFSVTFNKVLPSVKIVPFASIKVRYKDFDSSAFEDYFENNIEIKNLKIDWK